MSYGSLDGLSEDEVDELEKRGRTFGLSAREVRAADDLSMSLEAYVGMRGVRTVDDYTSARGDLAKDQEAREQAAHDLGVERHKAALKGAAT